jgi:hypothetical protein
MKYLSFASIKALLAEVDIHGQVIYCLFQCPATNEKFPASAPIIDLFSQHGKESENQQFEEFVFSIRYTVERSLMGYLSKPRSQRALQNEINFDDEDIQDAVVRAFQQISGNFVWDYKNKRWICFKAHEEDIKTDFEKQIKIAPVKLQYDKEILARMLVSVASADHVISYEEKVFLSEFLEQDIFALEDLAKLPAPNKSELSKTSTGAIRETILMITWAISFTDEHLDKVESDYLHFFADELDISEERSEQLKEYAKRYVLQRTILQLLHENAWGLGAREKVLRFASNIGLEESEANEMIKQVIS